MAGVALARASPQGIVVIVKAQASGCWTLIPRAQQALDLLAVGCIGLDVLGVAHARCHQYLRRCCWKGVYGRVARKQLAILCWFVCWSYSCWRSASQSNNAYIALKRERDTEFAARGTGAAGLFRARVGNGSALFAPGCWRRAQRHWGVDDRGL